MSIRRRDFLKTAPVAAGAVVLAATGRDVGAGALQTRAVRIGSDSYRPMRDYPIRAVGYTDVAVTDTFWKPTVDRNASITIPFEIDKRGDGGRGFGGNLLEAAILSLETHPDPALQARVDARIQALKESPGTGNRGSRSRPHGSTRPATGISSTTPSRRPTRSTRISRRTTRPSPAASATPPTACSSTA
jgi:hypothetical protein